jgi:hypothetical protein
LKFNANRDVDFNKYFWRTTQQQEIDYIEEFGNKLFAYEIKWNPKKKIVLSKTFSKAYPNTSFKIISQENFHEILLKT